MKLLSPLKSGFLPLKSKPHTVFSHFLLTMVNSPLLRFKPGANKKVFSIYWLYLTHLCTIDMLNAFITLFSTKPASCYQLMVPPLHYGISSVQLPLIWQTSLGSLSTMVRLSINFGMIKNLSSLIYKRLNVMPLCLFSLTTLRFIITPFFTLL